MKKLYIMALACLVGLGFTACSDDNGSNPTFNESVSTFTLNTPVQVNNLYDLEHSETIEFSASQADYGYTAPAQYALQVSLSPTGFNNADSLIELATVYTTAKFQVPAEEIAAAVTRLSPKAETDYPYETAVYFRAKSTITGGFRTDSTITNSHSVYSNVVTLPRVLAYYALPPVELPTTLYLAGSSTNDWANALEMIPVHSNDGMFWRIVYFPANATFQFNSVKAWDGNQFGGKATLEDHATTPANPTNGTEITVGTAGWYLLVVKTEVAGSQLACTVHFADPKVYLFGVASGGKWDFASAPTFTIPTTADGEFVSPAFTGTSATADDGLRMCVDVNVGNISGVDWWKSEFLIRNNKIEYRGTGGDQEPRVTVAAGQKATLKFTDGTGKVS